MEAFSDPHREASGDIFMSRDFGDVISVIDGRPELQSEIAAAPAEVCAFIKEKLNPLLQQRYLEEAVAQHVDRGREAIVVERIQMILATT